ncbi:hypothetical protein VPHK406_0112 [Vibrio phage K406]
MKKSPSFDNMYLFSHRTDLSKRNIQKLFENKLK